MENSKNSRKLFCVFLMFWPPKSETLFGLPPPPSFFALLKAILKRSSVEGIHPSWTSILPSVDLRLVLVFPFSGSSRGWREKCVKTDGRQPEEVFWDEIVSLKLLFLLPFVSIPPPHVEIYDHLEKNIISGWSQTILVFILRSQNQKRRNHLRVNKGRRSELI